MIQNPPLAPEPDFDLALFLFMRNDMASLNAGKACAQAHHAACQMLRVYAEHSQLKSWQRQTTHNYGTVLVFGASIDIIRKICTTSTEIYGLIGGQLYDPTYPVRDGQVTHLIPLVTCGYVLAPRQHQYVQGALSEYGLELMP